MRAPLLLGATLALAACADVAGPTRTEAPVELPGTLLVVRNWAADFDNSHSRGGANYPALPEGTPGLFRADGNGQFRPIFENAGINEFTGVELSPDGQRLAWQIPRDPRIRTGSRVVTLDLRTGERRTITPVSTTAAASEPEDISPTWSPDGTKLAMIRLTRDDRNRITGRSLIVTDAFGTVVATPIANAGEAELPRWHPDGRSLTVSRMVSDVLQSGQVVWRRELLRVGLDGTTTVVMHRDAPLRAVWSPDGRRFAGGASSGFTLRAPDGTLLESIATGFLTTEFAWSPDGRFLAYCGRDNRTFNPTVWLWDSKQRTHRRLSPEKVSDCRPMWGR